MADEAPTLTEGVNNLQPAVPTAEMAGPSAEIVPATDLSSQAVEIAEKEGFGNIADYARQVWDLAGTTTGGGLSGFVDRLGAVPTAMLVMAETAPQQEAGQEPGLALAGLGGAGELLQKAGQVLFPNQVGGETMAGGALGLVLTYGYEMYDAYASRGRKSSLGNLVKMVGGTIAFASVANHLFAH